MSIEQQLQDELDDAQNALAAAEIALLEANAAATSLREKAARLQAAVAALSGESPLRGEDSVPKEGNLGKESDPLEEMSPDEFDAHRRRKQREREKERLANDPLAHIKCAGCGQQGVMSEQYIQAPSGAPIKVLTCSSCGNQVL